MQACDLGIEGPNSFVLTYIKKASMARSLDELTEHEDVVLRGWIRGLFEAEGINDDLMSMCSPKEFHLLVATLFDQSLKAFHAQVLTPETSKSGFECEWHLNFFLGFFPLVFVFNPLLLSYISISPQPNTHPWLQMSHDSRPAFKFVFKAKREKNLTQP